MPYISEPKKKWVLPEPVNLNLITEHSLTNPIKSLLLRRGYINNKDVSEFLHPKVLPDPSNHFPELDKSVERILKALSNNENIAICGDYDADGMTSSALLRNVFQSIEASHEVLIPNRLEEGYGLNEAMVKELHNRKVSLIITVDNGVSAIEALRQAKELGIDLIITDHHKIPANLCDQYSLIHPEQTPLNSPYRFLAGVGLAYILSIKLLERTNIVNKKNACLDLFCIGTIADMSTLKGANRRLLIEGLAEISKSKSKGIKGLLELCGLKNKSVSSEDIAFRIAPRINSVGRISSPDVILDLLSATDDKDLKESLNFVEETNSKRKSLCNLIEKDVSSILNTDDHLTKNFIVLIGESWHAGVIGIVASRILEKYNKPVAILTKESNNIYRSSARAPKGFNLIGALDQCKSSLESYGGHKAAAGFTIKEENITTLINRLNKISNNYSKDIYVPRISPDIYLGFKDINNHFLDQLSKLEPFGIGNPKPLFWTREVLVIKTINLGNNHIKLILQQDQIKFDAVHWSSNFEYKYYSKIDIAFHIDDNPYKNNQKQLVIKCSRNNNFEEKFLFNNNTYYVSKVSKVDFIIRNKLGKELHSPDISSFLKGKNQREIEYINTLKSYSQIALGLVH